MNGLLSPISPDNPLVYLDICIGKEKAGRIVIELRKDVVPKTAENFRGLCTGEYGVGQLGKPLHYKGTRFHKVTRVFAAQGGDVVKNDGTSGESIYGPVFDDENFYLSHDEGIISMSNYGIPNSNNSQFSITSVPCENLDGTNVVVGRVLRGLGVIGEMEQNTSDDGKPTEEIYVDDCGEISPGENWGYCEKDETEDVLPPFPQDWIQKFEINKIEDMLAILTCLRNSGNYFFTKQLYYDARRKYRKGYRYYNFFHKCFEWKHIENSKENLKILDTFMAVTYVNMAAVELKLKENCLAKYYCSEAIRIDQLNSKAFYRRGLAQIETNDYDEAISDLKKANDLAPENKQILNELNRAKKLLTNYNRTQKSALKNLFKC